MQTPLQILIYLYVYYTTILYCRHFVPAFENYLSAYKYKSTKSLLTQQVIDMN